FCMLRKILVGLIGFIILLIVLFNVAGPFVFAKILESSIGAPVRIGNVHLDLFKSSFRIQDLVVKNPKGFEGRMALIPEIFVQIDLVDLNLGIARYVEITNYKQEKIYQFPFQVHKALHNVTDPKEITQEIVVTTLKQVGMSQLTSQLNLISQDLQTQFKQNFS